MNPMPKCPHWFWNLLSYLMDIPMEERSSSFNPSLQLFLSKGEFKLVSHHAIYSYGLKYYHFVEAFKKIHIQGSNIQNVLVLGLGTASIPEMLEKKFACNPRFDLVEIDAEVIFLFEKYQDYMVRGECKCYCQDGLDFLKTNKKSYDLICMDIFEDDQIPPPYETDEFLSLIHSSLLPGGWFLYNRLNVSSDDQRKNKSFYQQFCNILPGSAILATDYNWILTYRKGIQ